VRLYHLLSKEHLAAPLGVSCLKLSVDQANVLVQTLLTSGTSITWPEVLARPSSTSPPGEWKTRSSRVTGSGTLLGPEGSSSSITSVGTLTPRTAAVAVSVEPVRELRPLLENYTVDASIFVVMTSY
jgi:hypothetical protein